MSKRRPAVDHAATLRQAADQAAPQPVPHPHGRLSLHRLGPMAFVVHDEPRAVPSVAPWALAACHRDQAAILVAGVGAEPAQLGRLIVEAGQRAAEAAATRLLLGLSGAGARLNGEPSLAERLAVALGLEIVAPNGPVALAADHRLFVRPAPRNEFIGRWLLARPWDVVETGPARGTGLPGVRVETVEFGAWFPARPARTAAARGTAASDAPRPAETTPERSKAGGGEPTAEAGRAPGTVPPSAG